MQKFTQILRDVIIVTLVSVTLLLVCETFLRLKGYEGNHFRMILFGNDPNSIKLFENSATLWWRLRPNAAVEFLNSTVVTDSAGFRTARRPVAAAPTRYWPRVICLGDSSTFGWRLAIEDTYPFLLEKLLQSTHPNARVYNLGVPGYTSFQAKQYLYEKLDEIDPDIVIAYLSNNECSMTPISDRARREQEQNYLYLKRFLEQLYIYQLALEYSWQLKRPFFDITDMSLENYLQMQPRVSQQAFKNNITEIAAGLKRRCIPLLILTVPYDIRAAFKLAVPARNSKVNAGLDRAAAAITAGQLDLAERLIAAAEQRSPLYYRTSYLKGNLSSLKNLEEIGFYEDAIERYPFPNRLKKSYLDTIKKFADEQAVPCLDLYAAFRARLQQNRQSLFIDANHPNSAGYALIAKLIYNELKTMLPPIERNPADENDRSTQQ